MESVLFGHTHKVKLGANSEWRVDFVEFFTGEKDFVSSEAFLKFCNQDCSGFADIQSSEYSEDVSPFCF